jgi:adenylyl- and sulfurtransferase ThiI
MQEDFPLIALHKLQIIDAAMRLERIQENVVENCNLVFRRRFLTAYDFILEVIHETRHIDFVRAIGGAHFAGQANPYGGARKEHFPPAELH